jgi:hypothetical protein
MWRATPLPARDHITKRWDKFKPTHSAHSAHVTRIRLGMGDSSFCQKLV